MSVIDKIKLDGTTYDVGKTPDTTLAVSGSPADAAKVGTELDKKVDKVTGKGLSTEDFTTAEKTKLAGIAEGATALTIDDTLTQSGQAADAKAVGDEISDLKSALSLQKDISLSSEAHTNGLLGTAEIRDVTYTGINNVFQEILRIDIQAGIQYTLKFKLAETPSQSVYVYFIDSDGNYVESSSSVISSADANEHMATKTFSNSHENVIFAIKTKSGCKVSYASVEASETISDKIQQLDQQLDKTEVLTNSKILYDEHLKVSTKQTTSWLNGIIPATVSEFFIQIMSATGIIGTNTYYARVLAYYTDNTSAEILRITELDKTYNPKANESKTLDHWSLVLQVADETQQTNNETIWDIFAWEVATEEEEEEEMLPLAVIANVLKNSDVQNMPGIFYGPVEKEYVAENTNENWQTKSYVNIDNIQVGNYKYAYAIMMERHGLGLRGGAMFWYDSNASDALPVSNSSINVENYDKGPCIQKFNIPDGTVKIRAEFEGITNARSAGQSSVIGEKYYVRGCYVYLTNTLIEETGSTSLDSNWNEAIDSFREAQGTSFCFGIQTDTHFAITYPEYEGLQLKEATKYVGFDFIANLGDITRGYNGDNYPDSPENMRLYAKTIMKRYTDGVQCPFFVAIGNHEMNALWANAHPGTEKFTLSELYAQYTKQSINTSDKIVPVVGKSYFYADFAFARVIVLFTNDSSAGSFTVSADQVSWFTNVALNTTKPVLVLCHVPLVDGWSVSTNYSADYANIITPLESFKNNGGIVLACIYGHAHRQESQKINGIWHILCTKTEGQFTTAELFMIDTTSYDITTIGIGAAESRLFTH